MKTALPFLALILFAGCAEKEKKESTDWALSIQANTGTREQKQAIFKGTIRYIVDGVESTQELPEYDLPISAVIQFKADRILEVKADAVEYDYPVFFQVIRYENLNEIKWPEEAQDLETSRYLYARAENLTEGFSAVTESNPIEIKRILNEDALVYGEKDHLTRKQIVELFSNIAPEVNFEESKGWVQTAEEKYDTDLLSYTKDGEEVDLEFGVTSRAGEHRVESMELQIVFPIGKYDKYSDLIAEHSHRYIQSFLDSIVSEQSQSDWLVENLFEPIHSKHDGRILEIGGYWLTTYRIYWDYVEPVEHLGLLITTKP